MFKKTTTTAIVLAGFFFSSASHANEVSIEEFVTSMVSQAVATTKQELTYGVQEAVLTANNMISFEETESFATKVTITDLNVEEEQHDEAE